MWLWIIPEVFKNTNVFKNYLIYFFITLIVSFLFYAYGFRFEVSNFHDDWLEYIAFSVNFFITSTIFAVLISSPKKKYLPDDFSFIHLLKQISNQKIGTTLLKVIAGFLIPFFMVIVLFQYWLRTLVVLAIFFFIMAFFYNYGFIFVVFSICIIWNMFNFSTVFAEKGFTPEEEIYTKKELRK